MLFALCLPAHAHSGAEIEAWLEDWQARVPVAGLSLDDPLLAELTDFIDRHPEHFDPEWQAPTPSVRSVPNDSKSGTVSRGMGSNVEQWRGLVARYFDDGEVDRALCLMSYESGGNPNAKNPRSTAAGLFQFLKGTWNDVPREITGGSYESGQVYNPEANIRSAAWLQDHYGWTPWSPYNRGLCRG